MRITVDHLPSLPISLIAAAGVLVAIYTSSPAEARDLVGSQTTAQLKLAEVKNTGNSAAGTMRKSQKSDCANGNQPERDAQAEARRKTEFARRLLFVMLTMR